jgi:tetratricopeptide (TPR) repeat protein
VEPGYLCLLKCLINSLTILYNQSMTHTIGEEKVPQRSQGWVRAGLDRQYHQRYREAVTAYSRAIALDPDFPGFYAMRGFAYSKLGFDGKALTDYNRAIKLDPRGYEAYYMRGTLYAKRGDLAKAVRDLTRSLTLDPQQGDVFAMRGSVYMLMKETVKGVQDLKTAARMGHEGSRDYLKRRGIGWTE